MTIITRLVSNVAQKASDFMTCYKQGQKKIFVTTRRVTPHYFCYKQECGYSSAPFLPQLVTNEEIYDYMCAYESLGDLFAAEKYIATGGVEPRVMPSTQFMSDTFYGTDDDLCSMPVCQHFTKHGIPTMEEYPCEEPRSEAQFRLTKFRQNLYPPSPLMIHRAEYVHHSLPAVLNAIIRGPVLMAVDAPEEEYHMVRHNEHGVAVFRCDWSQHIHTRTTDPLGTHSVIAVGFGVCRLTGMPFIKIRNSWGEWHGDLGYFLLEVMFDVAEGVWACLSDVIAVRYYPEHGRVLAPRLT